VVPRLSAVDRHFRGDYDVLILYLEVRGSAAAVKRAVEGVEGTLVEEGVEVHWKFRQAKHPAITSCPVRLEQHFLGAEAFSPPISNASQWVVYISAAHEMC
jgi:hypothetical protein